MGKPSIIESLQVISPPDEEWLSRLRNGHYVWLSKERLWARVEWAWEPPDPGCVAGRIGIRKLLPDADGYRCWAGESWYIGADGRGFDGHQLLEPVANNCPLEGLPISEPWQRHVERELAHLQNRLERLECYSWPRFGDGR